MILFPMVVRLEGRKCIVVGGGQLAAAKAASLLSHGAKVVIVAPRAVNWIRTRARANKLKWRARRFSSGDLRSAFLAVAATNSPATNKAVFLACKARGVLCNVVDDPEHCDFFYPAVLQRGPLQIAISTSGRSPALAARIRADFEKQFGQEWGPFVESVGRQRKNILNSSISSAQKRKRLLEIAVPEFLQDFLPRGASRKSGSRGAQPKTSKP